MMARGDFSMWRTLLALAMIASPAHAEDIFANRSGFSPAEVSPASSARCDQLRAAAENLPDTGIRIDLSVTGKLTLVRSDDALWYLVACSDLRVMCVTYQSNDMQVGDAVEMRGAYRRLDANHVVLDPCLAQAESR
jgi:hypothetical protein